MELIASLLIVVIMLLLTIVSIMDKNSRKMLHENEEIYKLLMKDQAIQKEMLEALNAIEYHTKETSDKCKIRE